MKFTRITVNPKKMGGVPCLCDLRIPVATVVGMFAEGMRDNEILEAFPDLKIEDIQEALHYAAQAVREIIPEVLRKERLAFSLASIPYVSDREMQEIQEQFGSPSDYEDEEFVDMAKWVKHGHKISIEVI